MLTSKTQKQVADQISNSSNVIGKGTLITGDIETGGNIRVDGKIVGDVQSQAKVAMGEGSHIKGNLSSKTADIEGEIAGNLEIEELLILKSTAVIHGNITTPKLVIEPGAVFNGGCSMTSKSDITLSGKQREMA